MATHVGWGPVRRAPTPQGVVMQRPDATDVAPYGEWVLRGRRPQPGEKGIRVLTPTSTQQAADIVEIAPDEYGVMTRSYWRVTAVFDIAQTEPTHCRCRPVPHHPSDT